MMSKYPTRDQIKIGTVVSIETKKNQGKGILTKGTINEILTNSHSHPHGIKVRLEDGQVGRVKELQDLTMPTSTDGADLEITDIPKIENAHREFKEFYQYDPSIENLPNNSDKSKTIEKIKKSVQERFAIAVCAFGNSYEGGVLFVGIKSNGDISGLDKDKKLGDFVDYDDSFSNHMRDKLGNFIEDKAFLVSKVQVNFRKKNGKTICIVQVEPASNPLFIKSEKIKSFYTRGFSPRAEKLDPEDMIKYIKDRFHNK